MRKANPPRIQAIFIWPRTTLFSSRMVGSTICLSPEWETIPRGLQVFWRAWTLVMCSISDRVLPARLWEGNRGKKGRREREANRPSAILLEGMERGHCQTWKFELEL